MERVEFIHIETNVVRYAGGRLVPPMRVIGPVKLVTRLRSTLSGANARWWVEIPGRGAVGPNQLMSREERRVLGLNDAPYEPVIRVVAERFIWTPADTRDCPAPADLQEWVRESDRLPLVVQRGSLVINWAAAIREPIPDPVREVILSVRQAPRVEYATQGSLIVFQIAEFDEDDLPLREGSGNRRILNHYLIGHDGVVCRVIDGEYTAVVRVRQGRSCLILSPDHPDPVELIAPHYDRMYLLVHPVPRRGGD
ncbi:MAG: hypothetical protein RML46_12900 [Anaerolineae bacterium]|nr:hypothetical protein [Anaerolineae bacterium]